MVTLKEGTNRIFGKGGYRYEVEKSDAGLLCIVYCDGQRRASSSFRTVKAAGIWLKEWGCREFITNDMFDRGAARARAAVSDK